MPDDVLVEDATLALFTFWDRAVRPLGYTGPAWHEVSGEMRTAHLQTVRSFLTWLFAQPDAQQAATRPSNSPSSPPVRTTNARLGRTREEEQEIKRRWEEEARALLAIRPYSHRYLQRLLGERTGVNPSLTVVAGLIARCRPLSEQIGA